MLKCTERSQHWAKNPAMYFFFLILYEFKMCLPFVTSIVVGPVQDNYYKASSIQRDRTLGKFSTTAVILSF